MRSSATHYLLEPALYESTPHTSPSLRPTRGPSESDPEAGTAARGAALLDVVVDSGTDPRAMDLEGFGHESTLYPP